MARSAAALIIALTVAACVSPAPTEPTRQARQAKPSFQAVTPGVPGTTNCRGQTARFVAQGDAGLADTQGLGGLASLAGLSVAEINALIDQYCAGE